MNLGKLIIITCEKISITGSSLQEYDLCVAKIMVDKIATILVVVATLWLFYDDCG